MRKAAFCIHVLGNQICFEEHFRQNDESPFVSLKVYMQLQRARIEEEEK